MPFVLQLSRLLPRGQWPVGLGFEAFLEEGWFPAHLVRGGPPAATATVRGASPPPPRQRPSMEQHNTHNSSSALAALLPAAGPRHDRPALPALCSHLSEYYDGTIYDVELSRVRAICIWTPETGKAA